MPSVSTGCCTDGVPRNTSRRGAGTTWIGAVVNGLAVPSIACIVRLAVPVSTTDADAVALIEELVNVIVCVVTRRIAGLLDVTSAPVFTATGCVSARAESINWNGTPNGCERSMCVDVAAWKAGRVTVTMIVSPTYPGALATMVSIPARSAVRLTNADVPRSGCVNDTDAGVSVTPAPV